MPSFASTERVVTRNGAALHCRDRGEGPPVVLLAGWGLPGASWDGPPGDDPGDDPGDEPGNGQVDALCGAGLRCVTFDRRGHGRSPDPGGRYDFDTLADDLAAILEACDVAGATLVTFSAGSGEAVRYLARHGGRRVARLALIAPTTPLLARRPDNPAGIDPALFDAFVDTELRADWRGWLDRNARPFAGAHASQACLDWIAALALQTSPHALEAFYRELSTADLRGELRRLDLPVLVLQGDADATAPLDLTGRPTVALVPGARLAVYPGAPHGLFLSHPARLNADLIAFVREAA